MFLGNLVGGRFADRALMPMLFTALGALSLALLLFTATAHDKVLAAITLTLIGALGFATVPPLQKWVLDQASAAPTLASAANIGAFNLGNALAAWLGGVVIAAGLGYTSPNWVGALLSGTALLLSFLAAALDRRTRPTGRVVAQATPAEQAPATTRH
jgi:DHA1 family inner membrane transport protein